MAQLISIFLFDALLPAHYQLLKSLELALRAFCQLQVEDNGLRNHLPQADAMPIGCLYDLTHRRISNTASGIVDDAPQGLLIVRIGHHTEVGYHVLDLLALVEAQTSIDAIGNTVLAHLFLKRAALRVSAIENGKVAILTSVLALQPLDVVADDHRLLLVTIGWLQGE